MKEEFEEQLKEFVGSLQSYVSTEDGQWAVKGFIDVFKNVYTISSDTKIISKILEIHLFPKILEFSKKYGYKVVLAEHQNYYPDISFVSMSDENIKFAVDFKTTYRNPDKPFLCNGFTLGSHGKYFEDRSSTKNIQFPYSSYSGHFCLGIIYNRVDGSTIDETKSYAVSDLKSISSVVRDFHFFVAEKWKIASDKSGSGNTANIGSINNIEDILSENGMFSQLGESWFDDYWMNYNKITIPNGKKGTKKITSLKEFVEYRKGDTSKIVPKHNRAPKKAK
ncbi:EcoRV family type II restriction endonuclease [Balneatrix alpica]|uniref:EcoRV family type II restriction endonuclease n=1 Tax=Balneatrix alpica TaxID=75684 RepID=UPI00273925DF|nr:EcoRV family type II restriction endonuclease [Balneatrix alpica]